MKIEFIIDASNFGDTLGDVFNTLSHEQKLAIATEAFMKWMAEPYDTEYNAQKSKVISEFRLRGGTLRNTVRWEDIDISTATDKDIESTREFTERMQNFKSTKQVMVEETTKQIVDYYKKYIAEYIQSDVKTQEILQETIQKVTEQFPAMIHDAIVAYFGGQMSNIGSQIQSAIYQSTRAEEISKNIAQKLGTGSYQ